MWWPVICGASILSGMRLSLYGAYEVQVDIDNMLFSDVSVVV